MRENPPIPPFSPFFSNLQFPNFLFPSSSAEIVFPLSPEILLILKNFRSCLGGKFGKLTTFQIPFFREDHCVNLRSDRRMKQSFFPLYRSLKFHFRTGEDVRPSFPPCFESIKTSHPRSEKRKETKLSREKCLPLHAIKDAFPAFPPSHFFINGKQQTRVSSHFFFSLRPSLELKIKGCSCSCFLFQFSSPISQGREVTKK